MYHLILLLVHKVQVETKRELYKENERHTHRKRAREIEG